MTIGGAIAGLVGTNFVMGYKYYFEEGFSSGIGFMGIAVALLGLNNPFGVILAALLFGMLDYGGLVINTMVPKELVSILQAIVIIFVISSNKIFRRIVVDYLEKTNGIQWSAFGRCLIKYFRSRFSRRQFGSPSHMRSHL